HKQDKLSGITDPDDFYTVANTCLQKNFMYQFARPWLGDGLVTSDSSLWIAHRKLLNPAFSQTVLDGFMDVFNIQARRLVKDLEREVGKGPFDHYVYLRKNALEITFSTVFGVDLSDDKVLSDKYSHATEEIFEVIGERIQKFWLFSDFLFRYSSLKKKQDRNLKILHNMSNTVLKKRKEKYLKNGSKAVEEKIGGAKCKPFMDLLLELAIEKGAFTDQEIREHVDTMLFGSHDTTATALLFTMLLVASHPEVQEKIFEELHSVFGDEDRDVTKLDLSQLVYLDAVVKESIRMYPIAPVSGRELDQDVKLRNCTLRKGRSVFMLMYGAHRHPMWGPDAEQFKPERWLDPTSLPKNTAFVGFSIGKRICIGKTYAFMSMKTTLAHVYRHYRTSGDYSQMVLRIDVVLKAMSGHHITIDRRK
ncbi:cytochrome P450 4V2-like, partial [Bicyclus anynana]|uniref:Cytochrome P450 4V2-like n=1 Tax=Bicyclus anynana TaxID=110368 RepID=A0ABM3M0L4_BICAN